MVPLIGEPRTLLPPPSSLFPPPSSQWHQVLSSQPFSCLMERSHGPDDTLSEKFTWNSAGDDLILVVVKKK